jgi:hypothetical protein
VQARPANALLIRARQSNPDRFNDSVCLLDPTIFARHSLEGQTASPLCGIGKNAGQLELGRAVR